jgi:hypothetical protein
MAEDQSATPEAAASGGSAGGGSASGGSGSGGSGSGARVGGWILLGLGGLLLVGGIALVVIHLTQRDKNGYYTSSSVRVGAPGYAVTTEGLHIGDLPSVATDVIGRVRVNVQSNSGQALFVGIGSRADVDSYLGGVSRSEVTNVNGQDISYKVHPGGAPSGPPTQKSFWETSSTGSGRITVTWKVKGGTWVIVLMNASGAAPVSATVSVGANTNLILWVGIGLIVLGLIFDAGGTGLLVASRPRAIAA